MATFGQSMDEARERQSLFQEIDNLHRMLKEKAAWGEEMKKIVADLQHQLEEKDKTMNEPSITVQQVVADMQDKIFKMIAIIEDLRKAVHERDQKIADLQAGNQRLMLKNMHASNDRDNALFELKNLKQQPKLCGPSAVECYHKATSSGHVTFENWYNANIRSIDDVRAEDAARIAEMGRTIQSECERRVAAIKRIDDLEAKLANQVAATEAQSCDVMELNAAVSNRDAKIAELKARIGILQQNAAEQAKIISDMRGKQRERIAELESEVSSLHRRLEQASDAVLVGLDREQHQKKIAELKALVERLRQRIGDPKYLTPRQQVALELARIRIDIGSYNGTFVEYYEEADAFLAAGEGEQ